MPPIDFLGKLSYTNHIMCVACDSGAETAEDIVFDLIGMVVALEEEHDIEIDYEKYFPEGKDKLTTREVVNAIGMALTEHGIPNNLTRFLPDDGS